MALFNLFGKESKTEYKTENTFTDKSVNAGDGSTALGEGATLTILNEQLSDDVAMAALATQRDTASAAFGLGARAIDANRDVNIASLDTTTALARSAINSVQSMGEVASRERVDVLNTTNTALQSQQGVTDKLAALASGALERSQTPDSQITKTLLYVFGAVAVVLGLLFLKGRRA